MARSDLLLRLAESAVRGDQPQVRKTIEALVAEEHAKQHTALATRLEETLRPTNGATPMSSAPSARAGALFHEVIPRRSLDQLSLVDATRRVCLELIEEHQRVELLLAYGLEPRHRVLLVGPPGNGKTSLAEALAEAMTVPLLIVRYEALIGSFLGETAQRLAQLFDRVRTLRCVLFFDEFDTVGKERGDTHETGEIKRVVSSLLMQIDDLPPHVVVVAATNHAELLDRAVWRRFQVRIRLPRPSRKKTEVWIASLLTQFDVRVNVTPAAIAEALGPLSYAELEEFGADLRRRRALAGPEVSFDVLLKQRVGQWQRRRRAVRSETVL